ncbi:MAG: hypothetical protein JJ834_005965 [Prochlorococcus marinus XMU1425]|nr:hypothetical protein [Prochlorococcus marinus XMU1425]MCR8533489.1 hypothetical protein [Prochlorococcus marinus XMU1426]
MQSPTDRKELLTFLKTDPRMSICRDLAGETMVQYNKNAEDPSQRVIVFNRAEYKEKKNIFTKISGLFWVSWRDLRGTSYSNKNLDQQLKQTAAIMSISTLWDAFCTTPVIYAFSKAGGFLVSPLLTISYTLLLLIMSNKAGVFSVNRTKGNGRTASYLLGVFFLMSLAKTLMSGVGIDLISQQSRIRNLAAKDFIESKNLLVGNSKNAYQELLLSATNDCDRYAEEQAKLDTSRRVGRRQYQLIEEKMYKTPIVEGIKNPKILIDNYLTDLGVCRTKDLINSFIGKANFDADKAIQTRIDLKKAPVKYLYLLNRNQYYDLFKGNPIKGSENTFQNQSKIFKDAGIEFRTDCQENEVDCQGNLRWTDPGLAINKASSQFYEKVAKREFQSLGFSLIGFLISIILSSTAVVQLYTISIDPKLRASRSSYLAAVRNKFFSKVLEN